MSAAARVVQTIPASMNRYSAIPLLNGRKKRVCGYARVSTDLEEQQTSYEAQIDYYTNYIKSNPEWDYIDVYADEGLSATSTKKREQFKRMISDALAGKIDLIITKSVSRFARNTVDTLTIVRQLKEKGVEVYFEKENIFTLDSKGELLITIMSSLAQEESRSISENTTWGKRKQFADGKVSLPYAKFLGYEKGEDGLPKIVESEAKVVRLIYSMYLHGKTHNVIARHLTEQGIPTPAGKQKWSVSTVMSILQNEKYKGSARLQKYFTEDFLTKKVKVNEGEIQQFYIEKSHPAIIEPEMFDLVQTEIQRRKGAGRQQSGLHYFSSRIICGNCGSHYGSKTWHSNSKYKRTVWQCNGKYKSKNSTGEACQCQTPHLYEAAIQQIFVNAFNQIFMNRSQLIEDYTTVMIMLTDTANFDTESATLTEECDVVGRMIMDAIAENARIAQDQAEFNKRQDALYERYNAAKARLERIHAEKLERTAKRNRISRFISDLEQRDGLLEAFDEQLWCATVETITVHSEKAVVFAFKDGSVVNMDISQS